MSANFIEFATIAAGILAGAFGLIKFLAVQRTKERAEMFEFFENMQKQFIDFQTNKNGHTERVTTRFDQTVQQVNKTANEAINRNTKAVDRLTNEIENNHTNTIGVLDSATRTMGEVMKIQERAVRIVERYENKNQ